MVKNSSSLLLGIKHRNQDIALGKDNNINDTFYSVNKRRTGEKRNSQNGGHKAGETHMENDMFTTRSQDPAALLRENEKI